MSMFLITFPSAALDPDADLAAMSRDSHAVVEEAKAAGVHVLGYGPTS